MVIGEALLLASKSLGGISESPALDAKILLCHVLGCDKLSLSLNREKELTFDEQTHFEALVKRRKNAEPVAYIVGEKEFMSLPFYVDPNVLIPRPDTEILVQEAIKNYTGGSILDIGTGSGCIAVSLAYYIKEATVTALDISPSALLVAKKNALRNGVNIQFIEADILNDEICGKYDMIVSNPPYIKPSVIETLSPDVKLYEPYNALDGGDDGLKFYRRIIEKAPLNDNGVLLFEVGFDQARDVAQLMIEKFCSVEIVKDYGGIERVVIGFKTGQS